MSVAKELYEAYVAWCEQRGLEPLAQRSFGMALTSRGFERRRRGRGKHWWLGVGLLTPELAR
jgi:phage/plasmid-associated DNA primase